MMKCKSCCVIFGGKNFQFRTRVCMVLHKVRTTLEFPYTYVKFLGLIAL